MSWHHHGSIPNNKSDLKTFGVYTEPGTPGFLHLFWTRVQEPSGTTLMDFELNQSSTDCGHGVNPVRTEGDLLIEYRIEQGGATATLKIREWSGSAWGPAQDLTAIGAATGTINSSAIPVRSLMAWQRPPRSAREPSGRRRSTWTSSWTHRNAIRSAARSSRAEPRTASRPSSRTSSHPSPWRSRTAAGSWWRRSTRTGTRWRAPRSPSTLRPPMSGNHRPH
jgi:hypothetical protein